MGEQPDDLTDVDGDASTSWRRPALRQQLRGGIYGRLARSMGLERNPAAVIFGVITVGAVLAAEGARSEPFARSIGAAVAVLVLYWLVHAWSIDTGNRLETRRGFDIVSFFAVLGLESPIIRGAIPPILAVAIAGLAGAADRRAVFIGTIVAALMLVAIEFVAAMRNRMVGRQVVVQTAMGAVFGCGLIVLHFIVV